MTHPRAALVLLLVLSLCVPLPAVAAERAYGAEDFRNDVLVMIDGMEMALDRAARDPLVGPEVSRVLLASGMALPFPDSIRDAIKSATSEEMAQAQREFTTLPAMLKVPGLIDEALRELHTTVETSRAAGLCETNYDAFTSFKSKRSAVRGISATNNVLGITMRISSMIKTIVGAGTEDVPYVGRNISIPFIVLVGVQDIAINVLTLVADAISTSKDEDELSIDACCVDPQESQILSGRGCDNRDNDCDGTIDEAGEDLYSPTLKVDTSVFDRCYPTASEAQEAVVFAVSAADDCSDNAPVVQFGVAGCTGTANVQVADLNQNMATADYYLTVDDQAPALAVPQLSACYATIGDARNDIERTVVSDCTATLVDVGAVPSECAAELSVVAEDECGNRSSFLDDVVVDGTPPLVDIQTLLLPSVDGRFCFASPSQAISAIENSTSISDNCTPLSDLNLLTTTTGGPVCDMTVTRSATDGCGRIGQETLPVRIDSSPPSLSCSVASPTLWPANGSMVDVGFNLTVGDRCDPYDEIDIVVTVTSDEPTALARQTLSGNDPFPDAQLIRGADGNVETIMLRAERSDYGPADGRVYRIRVVATDSCGLESQTDCWVEVPRELSRGQGVNSGQKYRADRQN